MVNVHTRPFSWLETDVVYNHDNGTLVSTTLCPQYIQCDLDKQPITVTGLAL